MMSDKQCEHLLITNVVHPRGLSMEQTLCKSCQDVFKLAD